MPDKVDDFRARYRDDSNVYDALEALLEDYPAKRVFEALTLAVEKRVRVSLRLNNLEMVTFWQKCLKDAERMRKRAEKL